jgi:predicted nucleic acid-binding protein
LCLEKALCLCEVVYVKSGFLSFYDVCFHALAMIDVCYFVTADKRNFSKASLLGYIVLLAVWQSVENGL